jgi:hypothetical protein
MRVWSSQRHAVFAAIWKASEPITPAQIAAITGMKANGVQQHLSKLIDAEAITKVAYGRYQVENKAPLSAVDLQHKTFKQPSERVLERERRDDERWFEEIWLRQERRTKRVQEAERRAAERRAAPK